MPPAVLDVEVVVPLRWDDTAGGRAAARLQEMTAYLARLSAWADVTVVDGSAPGCFAVHDREWGHLVRHLRPADRPGLNRKVVGAVTGVLAARHDLVVLADDDVRYDRASLRALVDLLRDADLVRPANVFESWPWHARWDGARSLLNRAVAGDWPGTFAVRRGVVAAAGGWDPDVMFENLEMVRTVRAAGGRVVDAPQVLVARRPPTSRQFLDQRVRQAYDDLAQPWRLAWALATLPAVVLAARRRPVLLPVAAGCLVVLAERGRRRAGARDRVPADVPLFAPLWVSERAICSWLAVWRALRGGVPYRGARIRSAATPTWRLRRRLRDLAPRPDLRALPDAVTTPSAPTTGGPHDDRHAAPRAVA
ncbi:glycosyltransferase family 2 protein [Thalassiella azotivora]